MRAIVREILKKENISYKKLVKAPCGFTNQVYFVDDKYVIKISKNEELKKHLQKEADIYKNVKIDCCAEYISSGELNKCVYLIITKLEGTSLYSIWHTLNENQRRYCTSQIVKIIKDFNNSNSSFLNKEFRYDNWEEYIVYELEKRSKDLKKMGFDTTGLDRYIKEKIKPLFKENKYGLVYNDAHFDNFIYNNGKLYLIDFDRVIYAPIDQEMLIFKLMCDLPLKFASEADEGNIDVNDYLYIYPQFRMEYPEMFDIASIDRRIDVYHFNYLIEQAISINNKEWVKELFKQFSYITNA